MNSIILSRKTEFLNNNNNNNNRITPTSHNNKNTRNKQKIEALKIKMKKQLKKFMKC